MTNKIEITEQKLEYLHQDAKNDYRRIGNGRQPSDFKNAYLPISKQQGEALRKIIIKNDCKQVVEFGTSFGISTIYLADGVRQTNGRVITTELLESKAQRAIQNIKDVGLNDFVEVKIGDAMLTLKEHTTPIDFLFLDGWKDLYLPLFQLLEPQFHSDTLIYADNMDMAGTESYANYVLKRSETYSTQMVHDGKAFMTRVL